MKDIDALIDNLLVIRKAILEAEEEHREVVEHVHPNYRYSATNFIRYLKLRTFDLRKIQFRLSALGLSSISHSERHVLANVENILYFLYLSQGKDFQGKFRLGENPVNFLKSQRVLKKNTKRLLKTRKSARRTAIMVTLSVRATQYEHVKELILAGMEIARINCSHDDQQVWGKMVQNVRRATEETGMACTIYFDLAGPKLRTSSVNANGKKAFVLLHSEDRLHLYWEEKPAMSDWLNAEETQAAACTVPQIFEDVRTGESIWFDDGKIGGVIEEIRDKHLVIRITKTNPKGGKLRKEKGINLPETNLNLPSLTQEDLQNLPFVTEHADIIGFSFVRRPKDVQQL